jgi:hypothetical protein
MDQPVEVNPAEFVDARLEEHQPSRLSQSIWRWWLSSTLRAVILKLLGLEAEDYYKQSVAESMKLQTLRIGECIDHIVKLEQKIAYYELNSETLRSLKKRREREQDGQKILTLSAN